jgi:iron(III) transport system ATP-binding protein
MRAEIRSLQKQLGITTVYVTHDQEEAMAISDRIAVMNKGEIAQLGDAEELYRRPASVFVARFIGHANLLSAVVRSVAEGNVEIEIAGLRHSVGSESAHLQPGVAVTAVVRPEAISISLGSVSDRSIPGVVRSCTYLGDTCEYAVEAAGVVLQVAKANPQPIDRLAPGTAVSVQLPSSDVQLLQEGGQ